MIRLPADNYYWVGGTGNWSDYVTHWAVSSGGQLYHNHVPTPNDTVIFDSLSFSQPNDTVYADSAIAYCYTMKWENVQDFPVFMNRTQNSNEILKIYGSLQLDSGMTWAFTGDLRFEGMNAGNTIRTAGNFISDMVFGGDTAASWELLDSLHINTLNFSNGTFRTNGFPVYVNEICFWTNNHAIVRLDTSFISMNHFNFISPPWSLDPDSATILYTGGEFYGDNRHYNKVTFTSNVAIYNSNQFEEAIFDRGCSIASSNTFRRFFLINPGTSIILNSGIQLSIIDTISASGSCYSVNSIFGGAGSSVYKSTGSLYLDDVVLDDVSAAGGANFIATNCFTNGNCTGWTLLSPLVSRNLFWVNGSGAWNDTAHWSSTSGGQAGECPPTPADDIFFDNNSALSSSDTVFATLPNSFCNNLHWTNSPGIFAHSATRLHAYRDFSVSNLATEFPGEIFFRSDSVAAVDVPNHTYGNLYFVGDGSWSLNSDLVSVASILIDNGSFYSNQHNINAFIFDFEADSISLGGSQLQTPYCTFSQPGTIISSPASVSTSYFSDNTSSHFPLVNFPGGGTLMANSSFGKVNFNGQCSIEGSNIFDTLFFDPHGTEITIQSGGNETVNNDLTIISSCDAPVMLSSSIEGSAATFTSASAGVHISDIIMEDINGIGNANFLALNTVAIANVSGWNITPPPGGPLYWIGGTGNWNDPNHWSTSSGGAPGICVPNPLNDIFFDANSFTGNTDTVKINISYAYCRSMDWTGSSGFPSMIDAGNGNLLRCFGSFIIDTNVTVDHSTIIFRSVVPGNIINTNNQTIGYAKFSGLGGMWTLTGDLSATELSVEKGILKTAGKIINAGTLTSKGGVRELLLDSSFIYAQNFVIANDTAGILDADSSNITLTGNHFEAGVNNKYNIVTFINDVDVSGTDTIRFARFLKMTSIHNDFTFDTLFLDNPGYNVAITSGSTITLRGNMLTSGQASAMIGIETADGFTTATISKSTDTLCSDYLVLRGIAATGGAVFYAGYYSSDAGNNSGWTFQDCTPAMIDVWPGDANRDLIDDNLDLLAVGIAFGYTVNPRTNASINYTAQPNIVREILFANGTDIVNADCDGDGIIGYSDTTAIIQNYGLTHPARYVAPDSTQSASVPLYFTVPQYIPNVGDTVSIGIMLGNSTTPVSNVYGIAFTIAYNNDSIVPNSLWFDFTNSWMAPSGYEIHILKNFPATQTIECAICRTDHQNISGQGEIARLHFRVGSTPTSSFVCWYTNVTLINYNEVLFPVTCTDGYFHIATGVEEYTQNGFSAYPNPTTGIYFIDEPSFAGMESVITVNDVTGKIIETVSSHGESRITLHLEDVSTGIYFVKVTNEKGTFAERVVRQ